MITMIYWTILLLELLDDPREKSVLTDVVPILSESADPHLLSVDAVDFVVQKAIERSATAFPIAISQRNAGIGVLGFPVKFSYLVSYLSSCSEYRSRSAFCRSVSRAMRLTDWFTMWAVLAISSWKLSWVELGLSITDLFFKMVLFPINVYVIATSELP